MQLINKEIRKKLHLFLLENNFKLFQDNSYRIGRLNYYHSKEDEFEFKNNYLKSLFSIDDYLNHNFNIDNKHKKILLQFVEKNINFFLHDNSSDLFSLIPFKNSLLDLKIDPNQKIDLILNSKAKDFKINYFDISNLHTFLHDNFEKNKAKKYLIKFLKKRQNQLVLNTGKLIGDFLISKYSHDELKDFSFFSNISNIFNDINLDVFTELPYIVFRTHIDLSKASKKLEELNTISISLIIDSFNDFYFNKLNLKFNGTLEKNSYTITVFKYNKNDIVVNEHTSYDEYISFLSKFIIDYNKNGIKKDVNKDYLNAYALNYFIKLETNNSSSNIINNSIKKNKI